MVQKKSPCEIIQNQIVKQKLKLEQLQTKLEQEMQKGNNILPGPDVIKISMEKQNVNFDFNETITKKEADEFIEECLKNPCKEGLAPVKKRVVRKPKVKTI